MKRNLRSIDLNLLPVFEAIMENGQLGKAGECIGMSPPAMSAALQRLRHTIGDELFIRKRTGFTPTPRAERLHATVSEALNQIREEIEEKINFDPTVERRNFNIIGGDYAEIIFLGNLLRHLESIAPNITIEISPLEVGGLESKMKHGAVDFALYYQPVDSKELQAEHIASDRLVVVAKNDHPRVRLNITREQFNAEKHVTLHQNKMGLTHLENHMGEWGNSQSGKSEAQADQLGRKVAVRVSHFQNMIPVILNTDYLCTMPEGMAQLFARNNPIQILPFPSPIDPLEIYLVWPKICNSDIVHRWFRQQLKISCNLHKEPLTTDLAS
ncbi:LysR family transcriptional regulator [Microbulbifer sp. ZKSA006]|uniref:LysR family transcriptional regulator n=1 Tax=Microbulbifer sp. ZKSA006 TaxID=3243390 RepID=UPI0040390A63